MTTTEGTEDTEGKNLGGFTRTFAGRPKEMGPHNESSPKSSVQRFVSGRYFLLSSVSSVVVILHLCPLWWSFMTAEEADDLLFRPAPVISIRLRQKPAVTAIFRFNEADIRIAADHLARARQHQDERIILRMNNERGHGNALEVR